MRVKITLEGELSDELVVEGRDAVYLNLLVHKLKVEASKAECFKLTNQWWEREAVNGRTVSPSGEILCSD